MPWNQTRSIVPVASLNSATSLLPLFSPNNFNTGKLTRNLYIIGLGLNIFNLFYLGFIYMANRKML